MKKLSLLFTILVFGFGFNGYSQSNALLAPRFETSGLSDIQLQNNFNNFMLQTHSQFAKGQLNEFTGLGGTQRYFSNVWLAGTATNPHDATLGSPYVFNFDFKEHELYAQWKDTAIIVNSNHLKSFMLLENGQPHYFLRVPSIHLKFFFESLGYDPELKKDRVQLLKLRKVMVRKANKNDYAANFNGDFADKLDNEIEYFLIMPDNTHVKVKLTKKSISAAMPAYADKINEYFAVHNEKLDDRSAGDLIRYINQ